MLSRLAIMSMVVMVGTGFALAKEVSSSAEPAEKAWLGVYLGTTEDEGVKIIGIVGDDSPAAIAGLEDGDLIIRFDGEKVTGLGELVEVIQNSSPGQKVTVDLERDGREMSVAVVLGTRPENIELKGLRALKGLGWGCFGKGKGPHAFMFRGGHLPDELREIMEDIEFEAGQIKIHVECEDGEGTVTIEKDGETQTHEFDCERGWNAPESFMLNLHGDLDHLLDAYSSIKILKIPDLKIPDIDLDFDLDLDDIAAIKTLPGLKRHFSTITGRKSASTRFNIDSDGRITVTVSKGDAELTLNFDSAADLENSRPELYEKYEDMMSELE